MQVVVIDPRRTATCEIADLHLALEPGSDVLLFNGLLDHLRREDRLDWRFLESAATGFGETRSFHSPGERGDDGRGELVLHHLP